MKASDFSKDELNIIESETSIYDKFDPIIKKKVKEIGTWNKLLSIIRAFMLKNQEKLSTDIVGKQILVNEKMEKDILDALDIEKDDVKKAILDSTYFKGFGKQLQLTDQLCLGIPLILASLEYKRLDKHEESKLCYLLAFYKPYASRESQFFKFGVNEGQMMYTVEHLTDRFDLKTYKTVANVISKRADSSYLNYIEPVKKTDKLTDKELHVIYSSGIASRVNSFLNVIAEEYKKNSGKSINFEDSAIKGFDKDEDAEEYMDNDINSDVAIKNNEVNKVMNAIGQGKVDKGLVQIAAQFGFGSSSIQYTQILTSVIEEATDKMYSELPLFFNSLIGSFLFRMNPKTKTRYTISDYRSPVFIAAGVDILAGKKPNIRDKDMLKARELLKKMLSEHSIDYLNFGDTYKRKLEKALACYWVLLIKKS